MNGPGIHDVACAIAGNLSVDDRRNCEQDLLPHYLTFGETFGAPASAYKSFLAAYAREVVQRLLWFVTPKGAQPEEIIGAMVQRISAAIIGSDGHASSKVQRDFLRPCRRRAERADKGAREE